jgi:hypothetical protein
MLHVGCRDCGRCTESWAQWLLLEPFRLMIYCLLGGFLVCMFFRECPRCRHLMMQH